VRHTFFLAILVIVLAVVPASAQERVWTLDAADEDAFLVYGVPETDDVGMSLWCKIGTNKLTLFFPVTWTKLENEAVVPLTVILGETEFKLTGKATAGATVDGASIEAAVPETRPSFFDALKKADRMKLLTGEHKSVFPLVDVPLDGLLKLCQQPSMAE
jgi:hypothetical protein